MGSSSQQWFARSLKAPIERHEEGALLRLLTLEGSHMLSKHHGIKSSSVELCALQHHYHTCSSSTRCTPVGWLLHSLFVIFIFLASRSNIQGLLSSGRLG